MEPPRTIKCASFWDALVLRLMLEEQGAQVRPVDEAADLSMVASGGLDGIRAAVAQLGREFPHSGPVIVEGEEGDRDADTGAGDARERAAPDHPRDGEVVIVPGVPRYHRSGCTLIRFLGGDDVKTSTRQEAEADGCVPCRACQPG